MLAALAVRAPQVMNAIRSPMPVRLKVLNALMHMSPQQRLMVYAFLQVRGPGWAEVMLGPQCPGWAEVVLRACSCSWHVRRAIATGVRSCMQRCRAPAPDHVTAVNLPICIKLLAIMLLAGFSLCVWQCMASF